MGIPYSLVISVRGYRIHGKPGGPRVGLSIKWRIVRSRNLLVENSTFIVVVTKYFSHIMKMQ